MSDLCAMLKAYHLPRGVPMDEFYTAETMMEIWNNEFEAERLHDAYLDAYDPYGDYDEDGCDECYFVNCICDDAEHDSYDGREDIGMEAGLFGWDA